MGITREKLREMGFGLDNAGQPVRLAGHQQDRVGLLTALLQEGPPTVDAPKVVTRTQTKVEQRLERVLADTFPGACLIPQFRLRMTEWDAPRVMHYTADFAVWMPCGAGWTCHLYEAKDSRRKGHSDELGRPTLVLAQNRWIQGVTLATWDGKSFQFRLIAGQPNTTTTK